MRFDVVRVLGMATLLFALQLLAASPAYAGIRKSACGGDGQRACCVLEAVPSCDTGKVERGSCRSILGDSTCQCGTVPIIGTPIFASGVCVDITACGGNGQRACCAAERPLDPCNAGLTEQGNCSISLGPTKCFCPVALSSIGVCRAPNCGEENERACCLGEEQTLFGMSCAPGLIEVLGCSGGCNCSDITNPFFSLGTCRRPPPCGGEGERGCCVLLAELAPGGTHCDPDLIALAGCNGNCLCGGSVNLAGFESSTTCYDPSPCGGEGERACCAIERPFNPCDSGLKEVPGCTGDCFCGESLTGIVDDDFLGTSSGTCVRFEDIPEPAIGFTPPPSGQCDTGFCSVGDFACGDSTDEADCTALGGTCDPRSCEIDPECVSTAGFCASPAEPKRCSDDDDCNVAGKCGGFFQPCQDDADCFIVQCIGSKPGTCKEVEHAGTCGPLPCSMRGYADLHLHMFADIAHGGGVLAGAPCPRASTTYCPEAFTAGPLAPGQCANTYCDETFSLDVNDALTDCYGTDRDLVKKNGKALHNPEGILPPFCPSFLPGCGDKLFHGDHTLFDDAVGSGMGTLDGSQANIGAPAFNGWPQWTTTTHQQVYYKWLERAWRGGLRLVVQMAVTNTALCKTNKQLQGVDCDDSMAFVDQQLQAAYDLEHFIDLVVGNGTDNDEGWFRIVLTPAEARSAIADGKMAVVLGIEVDHLFNCKFPTHECTTSGNQLTSCSFTLDNNVCFDLNDPTKTSAQWVRDQVDYYYDTWGVRHMFPIHNFDNSFGGTATWQSPIEVGNRFVEGHWYATQVECADEGYRFRLGQEGVLMQFIAALFGFGIGDFTVPIRDETASCNFWGLFPLGEVLIERMMERGMIIDIDHMSNRSLDDTILLAQQRGGYPLAATHVLFFDLHKERIRHERMRTTAQLEAMRAMGSMVAVMLKDDVLDRSPVLFTASGGRGARETIDYANSGVIDDCRHSSKTFAQAYTYAVDKMDGRVAMGSDFNGVAGHFGPRFGSDACGGNSQERSKQLREGNRMQYPFTLDEFGSFSKQVSGQKTFDYNVSGMAHVGLLPDFVEDLKTIGLSEADLDPLFRSAEGYIQMWELARGDTVVDGCGDCRFSDVTPPVLTCPFNASAECTGVATSVAFQAGASDECSAVATSCSPASGDGFSLGSSEVFCTTTDETGNAASCTLNVIVQDTTQPAIAAPPALPSVECTSVQGATPDLGAPTASDVCDPAPAVGNDAPGIFPLRQMTTVTWTATDESNNSESATQDVTVVDTTPPTVACPSGITAECTEHGAAGVETGAATGSDVCGGVSFASNSPGTFPLGTTAVTHTGTDEQGLSTTCAQNVTVEDTTPPTISCPSGISAECTGDGTADVETGAATGSDVCGGVSFASDSPGTFPLGTTVVTHAGTDDQGLSTTCAQNVTVEDTTPPTIDSAAATPDSLWPPDHKMVSVAVGVVAGDVCDTASPVCTISGISSNEPVEGAGDGTTDPDWAITGPLAADLRAERSGNGTGREYTLEVTCTDDAGNSTLGSALVRVPHDRRN